MAVYVGTSGYYYPEWIGPAYPEGTKTGNMLEVYAGMFDILEINSTYYRPPKTDMFEKYPERTGGILQIVVKLHENFTHRRDFSKDDVKVFLDAVRPLEKYDLFAGFLAQFPQSFQLGADSTTYLSKLRSSFPERDFICEFRHNSWWQQEILNLLKELDIAMSSVDYPDINPLPPRGATYTVDPAYIRLHGRNAAGWYEGREQRYTYRYNEDELMSWVKKAKRLTEKAGKLIVIFNNHPFGHAPANANEFIKLLKDLIPAAFPVRQKTTVDTDQIGLFEKPSDE